MSQKGFSVLFVILAVVVLSSIAVGVFILKQNRSVNPQVDASEEYEATPDPLRTFVNKEFGYSFKYPYEYLVKENGENSYMVIKESESGEPINTNFAYLSIIPSVMESEGGEIYNYNTSETNTLFEMAAGETKSLRDETEDSDMHEYFTYKRLPDEILSGLITKIYLNEKPWEFPEGTKELRYYVEKDGYIYLLGAYFDFQTEEELTNIITSFQFK
jgi:hypothetical protein